MVAAISIGFERHRGSRVTEGGVLLRQPSPHANRPIRATNSPRMLAALTDLSRQWIDRIHARRPVKEIALDMDSSVSPTYGDQEGSAYWGMLVQTCSNQI